MPVPQQWPAEAGIEGAIFAQPAGESDQPAPQMIPSSEEWEGETAAAPVPVDVLNEGIPFTSETERVLEKAAAEAPGMPHSEPPPAAPAPVIEEEAHPVSERPAKPRRGWWQRLTQS
jgi:hypothetical protein